jgi:hypothetical protein
MRREGTFRFFMVIFSQNTLHIIEIYAILFPKAASVPPSPLPSSLWGGIF